MGVAASCVVVSFQVIKRFTRDNIARLQDLGNRDTVQLVTYRTVAAPRPGAEVPEVADSLSMQDSVTEEPAEVVLSDVRIASAELSVPVTDTDSSGKEQRVLLVEQWENPMHFQGYRWDGQLLVIYGLDLDGLDFLYRSGRLCIRCGGQELVLRENAAFERFPAVFLHPMRDE